MVPAVGLRTWNVVINTFTHSNYIVILKNNHHQFTQIHQKLDANAKEYRPLRTAAAIAEIRMKDNNDDELNNDHQQQ